MVRGNSLVKVSLLLAFVLGVGQTFSFSNGPLDSTATSKWLLDNERSPIDSLQIPGFGPVRVESLLSANSGSSKLDAQQSSCQLVQIVHLLHQVGCQPKAIVSFACTGSCSSYVQISTSKFWQHERSCSCCQQTGLQEATFTLDCPSLNPPYKKVKTYAPKDCLCRACTDLGKESLRPQELVEALAGESMVIDKQLQV